MGYQIDYIEFWATGHCNLNCKGCSSCSPLSKEWYLDKEDLKRDLERLKYLNIEIANITILGGEPLLHPDIMGIMRTVQQVFPQSRIGILTNGLLLLKMSNAFWDTCEELRVKFSVTCFPVMSVKMRGEIEEVLKDKRLDYHLTDKKWFNKILTQTHSDDLNEIINSCGCNNAYNLKGGKISRCTVPMAMPLLNEHFDAGMIETGTIDIYSVATGIEIMDFLEQPNEACRNCSAYPIKVPWERVIGEPRLTDWII